MEANQQSTFKKITQGYTSKIFLLVGILLLLLIPLLMIRNLINERNWTANQAEAEIMEAWGSQLVTAGPFIAIPGIRTLEYGRSQPFTLILTPAQLTITAGFETEIRRRGIFSVPLFSGQLSLDGSFNPASALAALLPNEEVFFEQAELIIALSNQKGIRRIDRAHWNSQELFLQPGSRGQNTSDMVISDRVRFNGAPMRNGIFAVVPEFTNSESEFNITIAIQGGQFIRFLPIGQDTHVNISTDWSSPSFQGSFLPSSSNITDDGFDALWDISYLSRDIPLFWKNETGTHGIDYSNLMFGVNFFRTIDTYALNDRAVKYAFLFLIVPFLTLFLLEILSKKKIHPVPYMLSGIANVVFYLLLLSLSEQIQFSLAYLIAASAVTVMMTLYSRSLLPSWNKSWYMGLVVIISYILLYVLLNAETYALLIGSIGIFVMIALIMFLTRKFDWYGSSEETQ